MAIYGCDGVISILIVVSNVKVVSLSGYVFEVNENLLKNNGIYDLCEYFETTLIKNESPSYAIDSLIKEFGKKKVRFLWKRGSASSGIKF